MKNFVSPGTDLTPTGVNRKITPSPAGEGDRPKICDEGVRSVPAKPCGAPRSIVCNQRVTSFKKALSRGLRRKMTAQEVLIWKHIRNKQLDGLKFRRQQVIDGFIVDFYCDEPGLVLEIDGSAHDKPGQQEYDARRDGVFIAKGLKVLRIFNEEVSADIDGVMEKIRQAVKPTTEQNGLA